MKDSAIALPGRDERGGRFSDWKIAVQSILGFWIFYALTVVARALLSADPLTILQNKLLTLGIGIALTVFVYLAIAGIAHRRGIRIRALTAFLASTAAAVVMSVVLLASMDKMRESREQFRYEAREGFVIVEQGQQIRIERKASEPLVLTLPRMGELDAGKKFRFAADSTVIWLFFFAAWSAFYLAWVAQAEALGARRRVAEAEAAAQSAQVRALRYQVNPHFLFNTLNSLSSLVLANRPAEAEEMILKLSNFFRTSLALDATADVTLAREIELQRLYLEIERVRFPKRLKIAIDVPDELLDVRVPGLILQPIVENAIKYGVSGTRDTVTLTIRARQLPDGRLTIEVRNTGGTKPARPRGNGAESGTGVGLNNVCQRLEARFGARSECTFGNLPDNGYLVVLTMPLERAHG